MSNENKVRLAHELLDEINARQDLTPEQTESLRSFLPERPKPVTLQDIYGRVCAVYSEVTDDEGPVRYRGSFIEWIDDLREDLARVIDEKPANPTHPEFLETEDDYDNAPEGTVVACDESLPWHKFGSEWSSVINYRHRYAKGMSSVRRRVLRWGNRK